MIMHRMCVMPWKMPFKKMNGTIMEMMVNGLLNASPWATIL
jgi:hypothetical protein